MFLSINNLNKYWYSFYKLYGSAILNLSDKWSNQEKIYGNSCTQYKVNQYYLAFYLAVMIKNELDKGYTTSATYYETKYNISDKKKILICYNINLDKIFDIFDIHFTEDSGIGEIGIEDTLVVEPNYTNSISTVNITNLLNNLNSCNSIYNDCI